jgi:hypothetical protein
VLALRREIRRAGWFNRHLARPRPEEAPEGQAGTTAVALAGLLMWAPVAAAQTTYTVTSGATAKAIGACCKYGTYAFVWNSVDGTVMVYRLDLQPVGWVYVGRYGQGASVPGSIPTITVNATTPIAVAQPNP